MGLTKLTTKAPRSRPRGACGGGSGRVRPRRKPAIGPVAMVARSSARARGAAPSGRGEAARIVDPCGMGVRERPLAIGPAAARGILRPLSDSCSKVHAGTSPEALAQELLRVSSRISSGSPRSRSSRTLDVPIEPDARRAVAQANGPHRAHELQEPGLALQGDAEVHRHEDRPVGGGRFLQGSVQDRRYRGGLQRQSRGEIDRQPPRQRPAEHKRARGRQQGRLHAQTMGQGPPENAPRATPPCAKVRWTALTRPRAQEGMARWPANQSSEAARDQPAPVRAAAPSAADKLGSKVRPVSARAR